MAEPILELKHVVFSAQNETIIRDVSLTIGEGQTIALAGPSGGGKSTVLKLAAGLLVPTMGKAYFRGRDISAMSRIQNLGFRREGAVVFQDSALWANQDLHQILELPLRIHFPRMTSYERDQRIKEVAAAVGYKRALAIRPDRLSMGEQKLIAFARAMLCRPSMLFLDEWTESLDDDAARRLIELVRKFKTEGLTIVFVSHDLKLIKSLADFVIIIVDGQVSMEFSGAQISDDTLVESLIEKGMDQCDLEYALLMR